MTSDDLRALIVMGVSGSGKSSVAETLARMLHWKFIDGDDLHPASNVAKMSAGQPLTDDDRTPWLTTIAARIDDVADGGGHLVVTCSALKRAYRDILVHGRGDVRLVFLDGRRDVIAQRMQRRTDHFMPTSLLDSQFATLEPPGDDEPALRVDIAGDVPSIVHDILARLHLTEMPRA